MFKIESLPLNTFWTLLRVVYSTFSSIILCSSGAWVICEYHHWNCASIALNIRFKMKAFVKERYARVSTGCIRSRIIDSWRLAPLLPPRCTPYASEVKVLFHKGDSLSTEFTHFCCCNVLLLHCWNLTEYLFVLRLQSEFHFQH